MKKAFGILTIWLLSIITISGQNHGGTDVSANSQIFIKKTTKAPNIDGVLDDDIWANAGKAENFWQYFPTDTINSVGTTEISMLYDDQYLYIGVKCYTSGNAFVIPSLKRDYNFSGNDNVTLLFDTYNDKTNAFAFGMNPYGVRREALIANGGRLRGAMNMSWDNKWFGDAQTYEDYWTAEFAIPFKTLRFTAGSEQWRFNCYRYDTQINEISSWMKIPQNYIIMDLSFMGNMVWEEPMDSQGPNISVIPYAITNVNRDYDDVTQENLQWTSDIGGDAKIAVTSGLNLDLTVNPDFSQVEVDEQVTDLSRFELFFPERRQFFIENEDLFGSFGIGRRVNPFFSRRIGIEIDPETGVNVQNPILYGARLSGKLTDNFRLGILNMQTQKLADAELPSFNYSVAALQQKVFDRSNISFIFVNKQAIRGDESNGDFNDYNRVAGLEYRLASADNRWNGKAFYHQAFTPYEDDQKFTQGLQIEYLRRDYRLEWSHLIIGDGFDAEVGFAPRKDYFLMSPEFELFFYPRKGLLNQVNVAIDTRFFYELGNAERQFNIGRGKLSERQTQSNINFRFSNNTRAEVEITEFDLTLLDDFDPTNLQDDGVVLKAGDRFHYWAMTANYGSDERKKFFFELTPNVGQFYNGFRTGLGGELSYRIQPYGIVSMAWDYNYVELEAPFKPVNIWLVGPKFDFTFSKNVFLTTFVQYNNQFDNLNINARFQWRYKPVSDFFIVYTDNYLTDSFSQFSSRNRTLVAKLTYWLNL